ncbi:MAG: glutamate racemase [Candidatus Kerfeldbacteria bacterium RIFCSPLOWO2_01_FULL_48_11]|uniref:Glutamate racemase n=1 Tax=Candidatus Kerfeldbacteria bacterium RIFCSPLOWO2_01_FULL_48_11 TaxID=1798543 RepID=A0A1G2B432_9BACT|nr:MAG: Glutamate racemase [Parcubacteria group bacterium GW2011_GWA2_48_9]KKW16517.1 MAG: Glutamate racemase [Parcubacteria group bacterium GW2011_GWC2_49_9]OGY83942.1 MAG: glutamate racemase [Candidatus Kerfeldbacteria bacterium RIFCSPLOWO2_01_FULL_48_11]HCJ52771.1 glutamate racemase [Candidatus Kerfeldbacteria bacterium]HCM68455.1 glutamate racemase [Candidatus Kerfeldbacteria bacterium]
MIGIFDSGVGGLTVVKELFKQMPGYSSVYFGDTARTPYGNKSPELVSAYAVENVRFLLDKGAKVIIVACNTASAVAMDALKKTYPDIPIFEVITPAVKHALAVTQTKRIGVIGTSATISSKIYERLIHESATGAVVIPKACPLFVPLVEENWLKHTETKMIMRKYLMPVKMKMIDTLILGCTHYPLLRPMIEQKMGKQVRIVDPAHETIRTLQKYLADNPSMDASLSKKVDHAFYFSDVTPKVKDIATRWLGKEVDPKKVTFA